MKQKTLVKTTATIQEKPITESQLYGLLLALAMALLLLSIAIVIVYFKNGVQNKITEKELTNPVQYNLFAEDTDLYKKEELQNFISDTNLLIIGGDINKIKTLKIMLEASLFKQKLGMLQNLYEVTNKEYLEKKVLYKNDKIKQSELNNLRLENELALKAIASCKKRQYKKWKENILNYKTQLKKLSDTTEHLVR